MKLVTSAEMSGIDRRAQEEFGIPATVLMESAGSAAWNLLQGEKLTAKPQTITFVVGSGNNGGDALVMARYCALHTDHIPQIVLARSKLRGEAGLQLRIVSALGIPIASWEEHKKKALAFIASADWVVDGLAGTGLKGALREPHVQIAARINASSARVAAVDAPSGVGDAVEPEGAVRADITLTMGLPKRCLFEPRNRVYCGTIRLVPVSFPRPLLEDDAFPGEFCPTGSLPTLVPSISPAAHKGERGVVAVFGGSPGTTGAAALASSAALHTGAGLVTLFADPKVYPILASQLVSVMVRPLEENANDPAGALTLPDLGRFGSAVVGPGWGVGESQAGLLRTLAKRMHAGVLDADGLTVLSQMERPPSFKSWVFTPHPGELATLLGTSTSSVLDSLFDACLRAAKRYGVVIVAKAATSVIARPDGAHCVVDGMNATLATAGSGDVLSGVIGALLARGADPWTAARAGVLAHAEAGLELRDSAGVFASSALPAAIGKCLGRVLFDGGDE